jgi:hypothetical protein
MKKKYKILAEFAKDVSYEHPMLKHISKQKTIF